MQRIVSHRVSLHCRVGRTVGASVGCVGVGCVGVWGLGVGGWGGGGVIVIQKVGRGYLC